MNTRNTRPVAGEHVWAGPENFFKFPSLSKLFWLFQSNMKSYEKLLCPCGQNHLRWSCLSISFNFLSEFGFNWTIDHNEDFNRQSKDWVRRAGGAGDWLLQLWLRSGLWLLTWVGCGPAKTIRTSFCRSGSSVLSIVWSLKIHLNRNQIDRQIF